MSKNTAKLTDPIWDSRNDDESEPRKMRTASEWIDKWMDQLGVPAEIRLSEALCEAYKLACEDCAKAILNENTVFGDQQIIKHLRDSKTPESFL